MKSRESAIVAHVPTYALSRRLEMLKAVEIAKGCDPMIWAQTVALEPAFTPIRLGQQMIDKSARPSAVLEDMAVGDDLIRLRIWISPERAFQWVRCESFLKQLASASRRMLFEIAGNRGGISLGFGCHREEVPTVQNAFEAKTEHCLLTPQQGALFDRASVGVQSEIKLRDYLPEPPYYRLLTRAEELQDSPYEGLIAALVKLQPPAVGLYQVVFQPVPPAHDWQQNVQLLTDLEYMGKQIGDLTMAQRYPQQTPSGALTPTAGRLESKAHNDKPFFAVAVRIAVSGGADPANSLQAMTTFMSLFQHGGRPLLYLTEEDYGRVLSPQAIRWMLSDGLTYRPGFLVNSDELAGLVHVPPVRLLERWASSLDVLDPLASTEADLSEGTPIGVAATADCQQIICVPPRMRRRHTHIVGRSDMGKSCLAESMALHDIQQGHGVAVLDPHGDLVERLLVQIPQEAVDRVIYFNPGDPNWVPLWNPMSKILGQDIGRMADDLIKVLKSFVSDWGDRMEHLLRHGIFGLKHLEYTTLLDLSDLLRTGTPESREIRGLLLQVVQNEVAQQFWRYDYEKYRPDEFGPPKHKLSKLLVGGTSALMLSQPYSAFTFRRIMDDGMIFLADLSSNLGTEVRDILGGFILAIIHATALSRSDIPPEKRKSFHVYVDEAHRFVTDCLEEMLVETRKFAVSLTLAHQYMRQFTREQMDAVGSVGSTIVFNVARQDADYLARSFQERVKAEDLIELENREAIVRIGTAVTKIRTLDLPPMPQVSFRDEIIERSHRKYCAPVGKVQEMIRRRHRHGGETFSPLVPTATETTNGVPYRERAYDEF